MKNKVAASLLVAGIFFGQASGVLVETNGYSAKETYLTVLRDETTSIEGFQEATKRIANILAYEASQCIESEKFEVSTGLGFARGAKFKQRVIIVPILRSGLTLLPQFQELYKGAPVGFIGLERNEETAIASKYYSNLPKDLCDKDFVIVLEPMLATGGSAIKAIEIILAAGAEEKNILFATVIAAVEGIEAVKKVYPKVRILPIAIDKKLNSKKYIVPGLGDFGDKFFGTVNIEQVK